MSGIAELHKALLDTIEALMDLNPAEGTPEFNLLRNLATIVEQYEKATLPPPAGDREDLL